MQPGIPRGCTEVNFGSRRRSRHQDPFRARAISYLDPRVFGLGIFIGLFRKCHNRVHLVQQRLRLQHRGHRPPGIPPTVGTHGVELHMGCFVVRLDPRGACGATELRYPDVVDRMGVLQHLSVKIGDQGALAVNRAPWDRGRFIVVHTDQTLRAIHQAQVLLSCGRLGVTEEVIDLPMVTREFLNPAKEWEDGRETSNSCYID